MQLSLGMERFVRAGLFVAVLLMVLSIAVPRFDSPQRPSANGTAAIATLRNLHRSQHEFRAAAYVDLDSDGLGESGFFAELSGVRAPRNQSNEVGGIIAPPLLSAAFQSLEEETAKRSGYRFRIVLPAQGGGWTCYSHTNTDPDRAERESYAQAWPEAGERSDRIFIIDPEGDVWSFKDEAMTYRGLETPPPVTFGIGLRSIGENKIARDADGRSWQRVR